MKILILCNDEISLYNYRAELLTALKEQGHEVIVSLPYLKDREDELTPLADAYEEIPVNNRGLNPFKDLKLKKNYVKLIKKIQPDVVLTIAVKPNIWGGMAAKKCKVPYFALIQGLGSGLRRGGLITKLVKFLYKKGLKKAAGVFIEGEDNTAYIAKMNLVEMSKVTVLPGPGVNLEHFALSPYPECGDGGTHFVYSSRIMKEKGVDELFNAFSRIKEEFPESRLTVLGKCSDDYTEKVAKLNGEGLIEYKGFVGSVKSYIEQAHCLVLPSYHEGVSIALLEAASMGRPVITTDADGCRECVNKTEPNGYVVPVMDEEALYEAMKKFIQLSFEEKAAMAAASRAYVEINYNRKTVTDKIIETITAVRQK